MSLDGGETDYSVTVKLKAFRLLEARVAELSGRVQALEPPDVRPGYSSCQATRYVTVTEEKWRLIEQVLEAAVAWSDTAWDDGRRLCPESREGQALLLSVRAYRKQADQ